LARQADARNALQSGGMPVAPRAVSAPDEIRILVEEFLAGSNEPALLEPGEELFPLTSGSFALEMRGSRLTLEAWDRTRNLTRRILAAQRTAAGRIELTVERFAKRQGTAYLLDMARRSGAELGRRSERLIFRERFRLMLRLQFPEWTLAELSAEPNLEYSLSPSFPRAFLKHGRYGWAAIACPPESDATAVLTFGLIWLSHLRRRERRVTIQGLAVYTPAGQERPTALRVQHLDPAAVRFALFTYTPRDNVSSIDPQDCGNLDTRLEPCRRADPGRDHPWRRIESHPAVEAIARHDGRVCLRVRGVEFAVLEGADLHFGLAQNGARRRPASDRHVPEIIRLIEELDRARAADTESREHPLYRQLPEAWLESQARSRLDVIDASLRPDPIYGQVPAFAGGERGIMDLLAVDYSGRLAVVELKASADIHLPLQALDYWVRVEWHRRRREFTSNGYFPRIELSDERPRLLLVSPSLEFHPTTETVLEYFAPYVEVERIGLAVEWRRGLETVFRLRGSERPR
jgi:hypothetical protein